MGKNYNKINGNHQLKGACNFKEDIEDYKYIITVKNVNI
jgi:hypothetical protein